MLLQDLIEVICVIIDDSKKDHIKIQDVRVGQKKEDLSSVGDYNLNCSPKGCPPFNDGNLRKGLRVSSCLSVSDINSYRSRHIAPHISVLPPFVFMPDDVRYRIIIFNNYK